MKTEIRIKMENESQKNYPRTGDVQRTIDSLLEL